MNVIAGIGRDQNGRNRRDHDDDENYPSGSPHVEAYIYTLNLVVNAFVFPALQSASAVRRPYNGVAMRSAVIVVCHNSAEHIEKCLRSLIGTPDWRVLIIDNNSQDDTVAKARRVSPEIQVVVNAQNLGFAAAVNQGLRTADSDLALILNPDVSADSTALEEISNAFIGPEIGAIGGRLCGEDRRPQVGFAIRGFPSLGSALAEVLLLNRLWPRNPWNRKYRGLDLDYMQTQEIEQPPGACLAVRRSAWKDVDGFDESFFPVWFEDVDFCRRLHDHGWKILYCPSAIFVHAGGHSVGLLHFRDRQAYWYGNLLLYFSKHESRLACIFLRVGIVTGLLLRSALTITGNGPNGVSTIAALRSYLYAIWMYGILGHTSPVAAGAQREKQLLDGETNDRI